MSGDQLEQLITSIHELKEGQDCLQRMMTEIKVEFGKIEERLQNGTRRFDEAERKYDNLEKRVRIMENKTSAIYAVAAAISTLVAIFTQIASFFIKGG